jgi:hypothetical protein
MTPDTLLALMFASYTLPIAFVYCKYRSATAGTRSISSIITSDEPFLSIMNNTPPPSLHDTVTIRDSNKTLSYCVYARNGGIHYRV